MNQDPNYKATWVLLDDFEARGLVLFNKENFDEEYFKNFLEFQKAFTHSFGDLVGKLDPFKNGYENSIIFAIYLESCFIVSHLDIMKTFLKIIINPQKIKGGFNDETTFRILTKKICNKMQYSEKLKKFHSWIVFSRFWNCHYSSKLSNLQKCKYCNLSK